MTSLTKDFIRSSRKKKTDLKLMEKDLYYANDKYMKLKHFVLSLSTCQLVVFARLSGLVVVSLPDLALG